MCGGARTKPAQINVENLQQFVDKVMEEEMNRGPNMKSYDENQTNRFPGHTFLCLYRDDCDRLQLDAMWWGINLFKNYKSFQTPVEDVTIKNGFKKMSHQSRCIIFVSSFMEKKCNFYPAVEDIMVLAGLYKVKKDFPGEYQFTFVTQPMTYSYSHIHDRCPVVLFNQRMVKEWMDRKPLNVTGFIQPVILSVYLASDSPRKQEPKPTYKHRGEEMVDEQIVDDEIVDEEIID